MDPKEAQSSAENIQGGSCYRQVAAGLINCLSISITGTPLGMLMHPDMAQLYSF